MEKTFLVPASRVLVVDDEALVRAVAVDFLSEAGYEVLEARTADEALLILESRLDVRVVFTDVEMPGTLNGVELAWRVHQRWPWMGLLVTSGRRTNDVLPSNGRFLPKPYAESVLVKHIDVLLQSFHVVLEPAPEACDVGLA